MYVEIVGLSGIDVDTLFTVLFVTLLGRNVICAIMVFLCCNTFAIPLTVIIKSHLDLKKKKDPFTL